MGNLGCKMDLYTGPIKNFGLLPYSIRYVIWASEPYIV